MKVVDIPEPIMLGDAKFSFIDFLRAAFSQYQPAGKGFEGIELAVKLSGFLADMKGKTSYPFEDADFEVVLKAAREASWNPAAAEKLMPFVKALKNPQDVKKG